MTVNGISGANNGMQAGSLGRITQMDSVSKNIQNQIANAQKKLQELSSNEELSIEDKMKKTECRSVTGKYAGDDFRRFLYETGKGTGLYGNTNGRQSRCVGI